MAMKHKLVALAKVRGQSGKGSATAHGNIGGSKQPKLKPVAEPGRRSLNPEQV